jgi:hypothetical protein
MKLIKHTLIVFLLLTLSGMMSCNDDDIDDCSGPMVLRDSSGLDGCGFLLQLNLGDEFRTLEPINLSDFDIQPVDGLEVCGEFIVRPDLASICQVGEIVELTSLTLR